MKKTGMTQNRLYVWLFAQLFAGLLINKLAITMSGLKHADYLIYVATAVTVSPLFFTWLMRTMVRDFVIDKTFFVVLACYLLIAVGFTKYLFHDAMPSFIAILVVMSFSVVPRMVFKRFKKYYNLP